MRAPETLFSAAHHRVSRTVEPQLPKKSAVGESRTPTIVRSPEPESESPPNHRRELAPWRGPTATRGHGAPRSATAKWGKKWGARRAVDKATKAHAGEREPARASRA